MIISIEGRESPVMATDQGQDGQAGGDLPVWSLDDLYPGRDSAELENDFEWLESGCSGFSRDYEGRIGTLGADELLAAIEAYEQISARVARISSYAQLHFAEQTTDPLRGKFLADCQQRLNAISGQLVFLDLEIAGIDDAAYEAMLAENAGLRRYRPVLDRLRKMRPHLLSLELEQYIVDKSAVGRSAWVRLFDETFARMRFGDGKTRNTLEETLTLLSDQRRPVRRKAYQALARAFDEHLPLLTLITNTLARDKAIGDDWRQFSSPQAERHLDNEVDAEVVESLHRAVSDSCQRTSHRYYRLKARMLGLKKLEIWDRNAPLKMESERRIGWREAKQTVQRAFSGFSPDMSGISARFFEKGWIDAEMRPGKASGAFSHPTTTDAHPYILLNYAGKPRDVMVLAHELGHGVHQVLAASQGELLSQTPLTLAETASVFAEMLTFHELLDGAQNRQQRQVLLASKVEDMINTVIRQIAFYDFESRLHDRRAEGELTSDEIGELWMGVQSESLGPAVNLPDSYRSFWCYVPHFIHAPFYVYAYAFGHGLVHALYSEFERGGDGFQDRYFDLLAAGGSRNYRDSLARFGLDPTEPAFWNTGLQVIEGLVDELEELDG